MSDYATDETTFSDVPAEPGSSPEGFDAPEAQEAEPWAGPTQSEWEQLTGTLGYLSSIVEQAQYDDELAYAEEQQSALDAMLDPYSDEYDPATFLQAQVEERLAPLQGYVERQAAESVLAEAEDQAFDLIESYGVPEEQAGAVYDAANESLRQAVEYLGVADINQLAETIAAQRGWDDIDATRQWIGQTALYTAAVQAQQQAQTVGGDERAVLKKYITSPTLQQSPSIQGRDEMDVVARHTLGDQS
jgi:hypothetical protein